MIKLIATDVDGTLVKDGSSEIYPEFIEKIKELREQDIIVCIASGRQSTSVERMFDEIKDDLIFIASNGAHVKCRGVDIHVAEMNWEYVKGLTHELRETPGCNIIWEGPGVTYVEPGNDKKFIKLLTEGYRNHVEEVEDILTAGKKIIKISAFNRPSIRDLGEGKIIPEWKDKVKATMAGEDWIDCMDKSVDKGAALGFIQRIFDISPEETMVFGDNNNDIGMLDVAKHSYAVASAPDVVKEHANNICPSWAEKGVYQVLKDFDFQ